MKKRKVLEGKKGTLHQPFFFCTSGMEGPHGGIRGYSLGNDALHSYTIHIY